jgi:DNA replication protein DnaC
MANENLTPEEAAQLKVPTRRMPRAHAVAIERFKESVSPEEFEERLKRSLKRDGVLVSADKKKRVEQASKEWKERVGKTFAEATTDDPRILDRVNRLVTGEGLHKTSIIFHGNLGVGKSWTSYAFINLAIEAGAVIPGQIVADTETGVLGRISSSGFKRADLLEELTHPRNKIYFIDDVGQGYFSNEQGRTEIWYELIDHVYTHQLTLLITTNKRLTDDSMGAWIGARAWDRLKVIVGSDGAIVPGVVNRRSSVLEKAEEKYRR